MASKFFQSLRRTTKQHVGGGKAPPPKDFTLTVITWNVGNAEPPKDFTDLLGPAGDPKSDMVVIGLQECAYEPSEPVQATDAAMAEEIKEDDHFLQKVQVHLGSHYVVINAQVLGEMRLFVLATKQLAESIAKSDGAVERTGFANVVANKGGIIVQIQIADIVIGFVSAHLAAHEGEHFRARRNEDVAEILKGTRSISDDPSIDAAALNHHVFWMGDLNYRMDVSHLNPEWEKLEHKEQFEKIQELVEKKDFETLAKGDEFFHERAAGNVLCQFIEGKLDHVPTFKVERVPELVYKDQRLPAYCDRILWRSFPNMVDDIEQMSLEALISVATSDHKPVKSTFKVKVPKPVQGKPVQKPKKEGLSIVIKDLRCTDLPNMDGEGGASDPFVVFKGKGLLGEKVEHKTTVKDDNLNPIWEDHEVPKMHARYAGIESVAQRHLFATVYDKDKYSKNDLIGTAVIPLEGASAPNGKAFSLPLTKYGRARGEIHGTIIAQPPLH